MNQSEILRLCSEYIRQAVAATGMSCTEFCERAGIKQQSTLSGWMHGYHVPTIETLMQIEQISGLCPDDYGIKLHAAMDCADEIRDIVRGGVYPPHIYTRLDITHPTLNRLINGGRIGIVTLLTIYEGWIEYDCARYFGSDEYRARLPVKEKIPLTQDDAVRRWVYNNFGPKMAVCVTRPQDGLWRFETDRLYTVDIEHLDGDKYRFRAVWKPKDRVSVERVIEIA